MKAILSFVTVGIFAVSSFAGGTKARPTEVLNTAETRTAASVPTDPEIFQILSAVNQAEVEAAAIAEGKSQNAEVKNFAAHMKKEHMKNKEQGEKLAQQLNATKANSPRATLLKDEAQEKITELQAKTGPEFDTSYINSQVSMHTQVLNEIQNTLIPNAKNAQLKSFLETTKAHVQKHLDKATKIQASLMKSAK